MASLLDYQNYYDQANRRALAPVVANPQREIALAIDKLNADRQAAAQMNVIDRQMQGYADRDVRNQQFEVQQYDRKVKGAMINAERWSNQLEEIESQLDAMGTVSLEDQTKVAQSNKAFFKALKEIDSNTDNAPLIQNGQVVQNLVPLAQRIAANQTAEFNDDTAESARMFIEGVKPLTFAAKDPGAVQALTKAAGQLQQSIRSLIDEYPEAGDALFQQPVGPQASNPQAAPSNELDDLLVGYPKPASQQATPTPAPAPAPYIPREFTGPGTEGSVPQYFRNLENNLFQNKPVTPPIGQGFYNAYQAVPNGSDAPLQDPLLNLIRKTDWGQRYFGNPNYQAPIPPENPSFVDPNSIISSPVSPAVVDELFRAFPGDR
jgi:hypothetical protein